MSLSLNRREAILSASGVFCARADGDRGVAGLGLGLDQIARRRRRHFGCAVQIEQIRAEPELRQLALRECSRLTPELALKWAAVEPERGALDFKRVDELSRFAIQHGMALRGHTLLWHHSVPRWAETALHERDGWMDVARYFGSVIPRYGDVIGCWDVVNEPVEIADGRGDGLRRNVFMEAFGPDYIGRALHEARNFAPRAELVINEYGLEYDADDDRKRRKALVRLLETLRTQGAPLNGVGLQSHLDLRKGPLALGGVKRLLDDISSLGLFVEITELDVKENDYTASMARRDALVADEARRYLDVVLASSAVRGVSTWGLSDRHSWLQVTAEDYSRFPNAWRDGSGPGLNRGLPFDAALRAKPLYHALAGALGRGAAFELKTRD